MAQENHTHHPRLLKMDYTPQVPVYNIESPEIPSGSTYFFNTDSGLRYEVRFAKKRDNYLGNILNFSVLNEEFEDEYSETNRGEVYRIITTVTEIIRIYHYYHSYSTSYEFSGEFKDRNDDGRSSKRTMLYYRKAQKLVDPAWEVDLNGNKVVVHRKKTRYA